PRRRAGAEIDIVPDLDARVVAAADRDVRLAGRGVENVVLDDDPVAVVLQLDLAVRGAARGVVDDGHVVRAAPARAVATHQDVALVAPRDEVVADRHVAHGLTTVLAGDLDADVAVVDLVPLDHDVASAVNVDAVGRSVAPIRGIRGRADVVDHVADTDAV